MKSRLKKFLCFLTAVLCAASAAASCTDSGKTGRAADDSGIIKNQAAETQTETEKETEMVLPDIPADADFEGYEFKILSNSNWDRDFYNRDFQVEELNGEPINDAIYRRNSAVCEKLNISISSDFICIADNGSKSFKKSVLAGDSAFDAAVMAATGVPHLAASGFLYDLNSAEYFDFSKPWWDQNACDTFEMNGILYYTNGAYSTIVDDCTYCLMFNKNMITDYGLENPYELIDKGVWDIDKFLSMISAVSEDVNGDGVFDKEDKYGMVVWHEIFEAIFSGIGEKIAAKDQNGKLELTLLNNDRFITAIDKSFDIICDDSCCFNVNAPGMDDLNDVQYMFTDDRALFHNRYVYIVQWFRNMDTDFGIIPYPKLDELQPNYNALVHPNGATFVCMPINSSNTERTSIILEAIAAESYYTIKPAYYETTLVGKLVRDDESVETLDILFENRNFDLGLYYDIGGYRGKMIDMYHNKKKDFMSVYKKYEKKAREQIDEINAAFDSPAYQK